MSLAEIIDGLRDGRFCQGELNSVEGFWFEITSDGLLLGEAQGEIFEIGRLIVAPGVRLDNP